MNVKALVKSALIHDGEYNRLFQFIRGFEKRRITGIDNHIIYKGAFLKNVDIVIRGNNNRIIINKGSRLEDTKVVIYGDENQIIIGERCVIKQGSFWAEDSKNTIAIGDMTSVSGHTHFAVCEGTSIEVGKDCMFSTDIYIATGDAHSVLNERGERVNRTESIIIGDHVWVGTKVVCLKGAKIPSNSIVGASSLVNKQFFKANVVIAGNPSKIVKEHIDWKRERI